MLRGGDENATLHQAGGIADPGYIAPDRLDRETIEIDSPEANPCACCAGKDAQPDRSTTVEAYSAEADRLSNCLLLNQMSDCKLLVINSIPPNAEMRLWQKVHRYWQN